MWNVWGKMKCIKAVVEQPEGKRPPGILRLRWEGVDWFQLAQDRDKWQDPLNMAVNCQVP
jgi:hypothetical protein